MVSRKRVNPAVLARHDSVIQEGSAQTLALFREALVPLFSHKGRRPEIVGTGVAVAAGDSRLIFTAAHVIRDFAADTIAVPYKCQWATLAGTAHSATTPGWKDPEDDRLDAAILELDAESGTNWSGWLSPDNLLPGAPATDKDRFLVAGFPRNKLKYNFDRRSVTPRAIPIFARPAPETDFPSLRITPATHIALQFNREKQLQDGAQVTAPSVRGVSGGMVLSAPDVLQQESLKSTGVAGIFIEWSSPKRFLIATRIDVHLKLLHESLPQISSLFPRPRTI